MKQLLLAVGLLACGVGWAGSVPRDLEKAQRLMDKNRFAEAVALLLPHAQAGAAEVEDVLAWAYLHDATDGKAREQIRYADIEPAITWATSAIAHGRLAGYAVLYTIHEEGLGMAPDPAKAYDYLRRGTEAGDASSKLNYAIRLFHGDEPHVSRDLPRACGYFDELAAAGQVDMVAAYYFGLIRLDGECGKTRDEKAAAALIRKSAEAGVRIAEAHLGSLYEEGKGLKPDLGQALKWWERAAAQGQAYALWRIGIAYVRGEGRRPDPVRAVDYFERSAQAGDVNGMTSLAVMYANGQGVQQNFYTAVKWYGRAAEAGSDHAMKALGTMYLRGEGVGEDLVRGVALLLRAEALGNAEAPRWLSQARPQLSAEQLAQAEQEAADYAAGRKPQRWQ